MSEAASPSGDDHDLAVTLESLYNLNKHARKYAEKAESHWNVGKKATARKNSVRKQALYDLKDEVLRQLYTRGEVDRVTRHIIESDHGKRPYYCFEIGTRSFHTPIEDWPFNTSPTVKATETLEDFEKTSEKTESDMSLKVALLHVEREWDACANDYLEDEYIEYGRNSYFAGWTYLGEDDE